MSITSALPATERIRVLLLDGRNNHDWQRTSEALRQTLIATGRFEVNVSSAPEAFTEPAWRPDFAGHQVVVNNYNGPEWPEAVKAGLVEFVRAGGGLVNVHAANNAFAGWKEFNEMLGLGWRNASKGKRLVIDDNDGKTVEPSGPPAGMRGADPGHGSVHEFVIKHRELNHPILAGLPRVWMHGADELYHGQHGPAENLTILASAWSDPSERGSGLHEPVLWTVNYGRGRVVTTSLGHLWRGQESADSLHCVGFQTILARSTEWAATGAVSLAVPSAFPSPYQSSLAMPDRLDWQTLRHAGAPLFPALTPGQSLRQMVLPAGYHAELVACEPMIEEPVCIAWDGNGRLYVAEMRSYMQDAEGTGSAAHSGRIKRLEDTNGDGVMDRMTVFADNLLLPRMLLPLDDRVVVQETDDSTLWSLRDSDGDGVADQKTVLWQGAPRKGSVEHQDSALIWGLDNWLYSAQGGQRYRFRGEQGNAGKSNKTQDAARLEAQRCLGEFDQWGLGMDDSGRLYFSQNSIPGRSFQQPWYAWDLIGGKTNWKFERPALGGLDTDEAFQKVFPLNAIGDRADGPLTSYTAACGLSIYRGDALPDLNGDLFLAEPCGHLVRRARIVREAGKIRLTNAYENKEFLASRDMYCRPVCTATGPDGCLYIVDMCRGIIQDKPWVGREFAERIRQLGLDQVKMHGRIWRIVPDRWQRPPAPRMLEADSTALVGQLAATNGWTRDTAQKLLVLRNDATVIPALAAMARTHVAPLGRLHALWTLEGLGAADSALLFEKLGDSDPLVREAAIRICEPLVARGDQATLAKLSALAADPDISVCRQLILSLGRSDLPAAQDTIGRIAREHITNEIIFLATVTALWQRQTPFVASVLDGSAFREIKDTALRSATQGRWKAGLATWSGAAAPPRLLDPEALALVEKGAEIYQQLCISCHGADGKGLQPPGQGKLAPALAGSPRVTGPKEVVTRILLHGLSGQIEGKTYEAGVMAPMGLNDDFWIASVLTYIRQEWSNSALPIRPPQVAAIRELTKARDTHWTLAELTCYDLPLLTNHTGWKATAQGDAPQNAIDGKRGGSHAEAWFGSNKPGAWFALDLASPHFITGLVLDAFYDERYPRQWQLQVSEDGRSWSAPVASGSGGGMLTTISFEPVKARHLKITQTGEAKAGWVISELQVHGAPAGP